MGNSGFVIACGGSGTVHPHVRGEQFKPFERVAQHVGSSPRTWGTVGFWNLGALQQRFIPTYVGNRGLRQKPGHHRTVHPHVRGEQYQAGSAVDALHGSSPRTWGTVIKPNRELIENRFIPTYVGNRSKNQPQPPETPVHPHVRGEQLIGAVCPSGRVGSSPRTWGTDGYDHI